jgi:hypothetical protein
MCPLVLSTRDTTPGTLLGLVHCTPLDPEYEAGTSGRSPNLQASGIKEERPASRSREIVTTVPPISGPMVGAADLIEMSPWNVYCTDVDVSTAVLSLDSPSFADTFVTERRSVATQLELILGVMH